MEAIGRFTILVALAGMLAFAVPNPAAAQEPSGPGVGKDEFDNTMETSSSVPGEDATAKPEPVQNFSKADKDAIRGDPAPGVKVIDDKVWQKATPEERDAKLREIEKTRDTETTTVVITVPKGEVWIIPNEKLGKLRTDGKVRRWTAAQIEALPPTRRVATKDPSHSDNKTQEVTSDEPDLP